MMSINYIGSKRSLFPLLDEVFSKYVKKDTVFADLFAGTGIVSYLVSKKYDCNIVTNDMQYYSFVFNKANMAKYTDNDITIISEKIKEYNNTDLIIEDFFTDNYAPPKRMYFTVENARKIDTIRYMIEEDRKVVSENVYYYLLSCLISAADKVANTSSVYASYLKEFKKSALNTLSLKSCVEKSISNRENICLNKNIIDVLDINYDVVYLDPPYNGRQYANYYHVLETIAKDDNPEISGITGMRNYDNQKSDFCSQTKAIEVFEKLIKNIKSKIIILSYNDEGIISHDDIMKILNKKGKVIVKKQEYKKFKAQKSVKRGNVYEYLFIVEV